MIFVSIGFALLIGVIFILSGQLLKRKPPKNINAIYGYRTSRSMKNLDLWNEANQYSSKIMINNGYVMIVAGCLVGMGLGVKYQVAAIFSIMGMMLLLIIMMFIQVERRLKQLDK
ncbi:SdpI family protein [Paenibacillus periandrae]|uniref:SdpI family protein n=1 Tax=Paenibacillus periandrae TaxID=1761741 RepID=UPI001F095C18|nr:SdpI family protein [Paenibacillus periandrae]